MQRLVTSVCLFMALAIGRAQVNFISSTLPIVKIETNGQEIGIEQKVNVTLKIIANNNNQLNMVNGEPNVYNGTAGIEYRGSTSLVQEKPPYNIELRTPAGVDSAVALLGMPKEADWVLLAPYSDKSLIREHLTYTWAGRMMAWAPRTRFVEVVLDNNYQGVYVLTESIKRDSNRVNVSKLKTTDNTGTALTGGYIIKHDKCNGSTGCITWPSSLQATNSNNAVHYMLHYPKNDNATPQQIDYIKNWTLMMEEVLMSSDWLDPDNGYRKYLDVNSFVDFLLINEITRNIDGYRVSSYYHKHKDNIYGGRLFAGPVWDFNIALGNANYCAGSDIEGWSYDFNSICSSDLVVPAIWERLLQDSAFKSKIRTRWFELRNTMWHTDSIMAQINQLENVLVQPAYRNFTQHQILGEYVWPNSFVGATWAEELDYLRNWLKDRAAWIDSQLINYPIVSDNDVTENRGYIWPNPVVAGEPVFFEGRADYVECVDMFGRVVYARQLTEYPFAVQLPHHGTYALRYYFEGVPVGVFMLTLL